MLKQSRIRDLHISYGSAAAACVVVLLLCMLSSMAVGQVLYGVLTGNITDPSGAALAGAKVVARNLQTGASLETTADDSGIYRFQALQEGKYELSVSAPRRHAVAGRQNSRERHRHR